MVETGSNPCKGDQLFYAKKLYLSQKAKNAFTNAKITYLSITKLHFFVEKLAIKNLA